MCAGMPCLENMWVRNIWATTGASIVSWVGMKMTCFVSLSTMTRMAENPSDLGSCLMKSIEIEDQGVGWDWELFQLTIWFVAGGFGPCTTCAGLHIICNHLP